MTEDFINVYGNYAIKLLRLQNDMIQTFERYRRGNKQTVEAAACDYDVPPSRGLRTVGYHLALIRRVAERRPDVQFVTYDRHRYRHWLGSRPDTAAMRNAWAASRDRA